MLVRDQAVSMRRTGGLFEKNRVLFTQQNTNQYKTKNLITRPIKEVNKIELYSKRQQHKRLTEQTDLT